MACVLNKVLGYFDEDRFGSVWYGDVDCPNLYWDCMIWFDLIWVYGIVCFGPVLIL